MKTKKVNSFIEVLKVLEKFKTENRIIFRGQSNADWQLCSKIGRKEYYSFVKNKHNEKIIFNSWKRYAPFYFEKELQNDWDWLALAQHYGLATRLLDWTKNPLNALYFAVDGNKENDAALYILNPEIPFVNDFSISPFDINDVMLFYPKGLSSRIVHQRGVFTISSKPFQPQEEYIDKNLTKIIIKGSAKEEILSMLFFCGINALSIFQDLASLSKTMNEFLIKRFTKIEEIEKMDWD